MTVLTPLDSWIRRKIGFGSQAGPGLFGEALRDYQLRKLNETIEFARRKSPFYRRQLASLPSAPLSAPADLTRIPFTTPRDIAANPYGFLAVSLNDVARIVTLRTSGSTGEAKRLFFTEEDLELTTDFFHHGMSTLVRPGQKVAILLPGEKPDSVGDLLMRGLRRMDVDSLVYGPISDPPHAASAVADFGAHCLVGIPTQVLALARSDTGAAIGTGAIESVLLSTDYVPDAIARTLEATWGCRVFNHYGMTETGLGGGVECDALDGYHLREADLYFEIIDHETGDPCPDGVTGEAVFTTLTRRATPLIRYRTGDIARFIPEPCACGTVLRRMDRVKGRWDGNVLLAPGCTFSLADTDEALFRLTGLLDYRVRIERKADGKLLMNLEIHNEEGDMPTEAEVLRSLREVEAIGRALAGGSLNEPRIHFSDEGRWSTTGVSKRKIMIESGPVA
jgi:phenylacetate-CoA ligase